MRLVDGVLPCGWRRKTFPLGLTFFRPFQHLPFAFQRPLHIPKTCNRTGRFSDAAWTSAADVHRPCNLEDKQYLPLGVGVVWSIVGPRDDPLTSISPPTVSTSGTHLSLDRLMYLVRYVVREGKVSDSSDMAPSALEWRGPTWLQRGYDDVRSRESRLLRMYTASNTAPRYRVSGLGSWHASVSCGKPPSFP